MKIGLITLIILLGLNPKLHAFQEKSFPKIEVKITEKEKLTCKLETNNKVYFCKKGGETFFLRNDGDHFYLIKVDKDYNISKVRFKSIKSNDIALETTNSEEALTNNPYPDAYQEHFDKVTIPTFFFNDYQGNKEIPLTDGSDEYKRIVQELNKEKEAYNKKFYNAVSANDFSAALSDGSEVQCQRLASKQVDKKCKLFECSETNGDKNLMLFDGKENSGSYPIPILFSANENGMVKSRDILEVKHPDLKFPIANNNAIIKDSNHPIVKSRSYFKEFAGDKIGDQIDNIVTLQDPSVKYLFETNQKQCVDQHNILSYVQKSKNKLLDQLSTISLSEVIMVLDNNALISIFAGDEFAKSHGCYYKGLYYDKNAQKHFGKIVNSIQRQPLNNQSISMQKAQELFKKATQMKDIAFKYAYDGCYARAHLMARRFEEEGIHVDKAWIKGDLYVPGTDIEWNYHVAPLVYVDGPNGEIKKMVIDPSLFDRPVTLEEWDNKIAKKTRGGSVMTSFPYPENPVMFERSALAISSSEPYTPYMDINMTENEKMEAATSVMKEYIKKVGN